MTEKLILVRERDLNRLYSLNARLAEVIDLREHTLSFDLEVIIENLLDIIGLLSVHSVEAPANTLPEMTFSGPPAPNLGSGIVAEARASVALDGDTRMVNVSEQDAESQD